MPTVAFHFDFISPYSYLASQLLDRDPQLSRITFEDVPVILGTMLAKRGVQGPGEIPERRRHQLEDVMLLCQHFGLPLEGPPTHPFNSIYALRCAASIEAPHLRRAFVRTCFDAAWGQGRDLAEPDVVKACGRDVGLDLDPIELASDRSLRQALKANTRRALELGAWGVPTFVVDGLLFFGHDRLSLLAAYVEGAVRPNRERLERLLERPQPGRIT